MCDISKKNHFDVRTQCVVCGNNDFENVYENENYPIQFTPPPLESSVKDDNTETLFFIGCKNCGCVQIKFLIDPSLLYGAAYNITYNYPLMKNHHYKFAEFVIKNLINENIIEIGGSNGVLSNILTQKIENKILKYTVLDLCDRKPENLKVDFIKANCETYNFPSNNTIILSHVYEHLYNPFKFTKNLKKNNVNQIIIANPDFIGLLERKDMSFINFEHTFFCPTAYLDYIMEKNGYYRNNIKNHEKWAIFYSYIKKNNTVSQININDNLHFLNEVKQYLLNRENMFKKIKIDNDNKIFIFPAGHYGQLCYHFLDENVKKNVEGFIDGDPFKIGKRVYGTEKFTYKKSKITTYKNINIIICSERYRTEMAKEINILKKNVNIVHI